MKKPLLTAVMGAVSSVIIAFGAYASPPESQPIVGPGAVWQDAQRYTEKIGEGLERFIREFEEASVSYQTKGKGYIRRFRKVGPVDIAYVDFPFRANQNNGILLVNGSPAFIDVDDLQALPKKDLEKDPAYKAILAKFREPMLFAGDRFSADIPTVEALAGGGQTFIVPYRLTNVCRACELLATVRFGFEFDGSGKLLGIKYVGLEPADIAAEPK